MNKYELSPWHQPTTSGSVPHNSYVGSSVEYSPGVGVYGVCHPQPHPQFQFSPFTPGQGTAAEVPQRASYVPAQVPLASTFVQPQTATVTTTVQTTAFLSQTPSQATTCYSQCPQQAAPAVTEPSFLNQTAAVESLNTPSGGSSTRLSVGSPQRLTTTGNPLLFTNSSAETNQPSDLQASNSTAKSAQSSPASPLTQPVPAQPTLASKSSSNTEQSQGEPLIQSQKAPSEPRKWWAQKVRRQDPSEGNGSGNNSTTSGNSNSGSSNSSSDQITFKTDGSGSSLGPWKLQPQQPLPKKAENELIKARMYLEQVKKKPSDEFIKNRLEKIKMLNGGAPDWVPNNDSPVCTFCGKIFSVIIRRVFLTHHTSHTHTHIWGED